jgi:hypothetical protein
MNTTVGNSTLGTVSTRGSRVALLTLQCGGGSVTAVALFIKRNCGLLVGVVCARSVTMKKRASNE